MNTSIQKDLPPLLNPRSFDGLTTQLTNLGLRHKEFITEDDREYECCPLDNTYAIKRLRSIASKRGDSFVCLNPSNYPASDLLKHFADAGHGDKPDTTFRLEHGFKQPYEQSWKRRINENGEDDEGQELTLVIFEDDKPVGFQGFGVSIYKDDVENPMKISLTINLNLVHVIKSHRKKGYGLDLAIGCGHITNNIISALLKVVPDHTSLQVIVDSDLETSGGEMVAERIFDVIESDREHQILKCNRPTIDLLPVEYECGI